MKKALIYSRVSTEEQAKEDRYSLAAQKRLCQEFAEREGYQIVAIFEDAGKSATNLNRPAYKAMMAYIVEHEDIDAILVQDTDRIARNEIDHFSTKAILRQNNVKLISVSQPQIDDSGEGQLMDTFMAGINSFQSKMIGRKTKHGLEQKARDGWFPTFAPIGYRNIVAKNDKRIIAIDPSRAHLVKEAFDLYASGSYGAEALNDILYEKGLRSVRGKKLATSKLYWLLTNPFYYGYFRWDGKIYEGKHTPIINKETFDLAQRIRISRSIRKNCERKHTFLLSGFVFCKCGRRFTAETHTKPSGRVYKYYHCTRGKKCQASVNVLCDNLEKQVEEKFKEVQFSEDFYHKLIGQLNNYYNDYQQQIKREVSVLIKQKVAVEAKRDKIEHLLFDDTIDVDAYKRHSQQFNREIETIEGRLSELKQTKEINIGSFEEVANFAKDIYKIYQTGDYEIKRLCLGFFFEKFIVRNNKIIEAIPTELFRALQALQKPPVKEASATLVDVLSKDFNIVQGQFTTLKNFTNKL